MKSINPRIERLKEMMSLEEKRVALQQQLDAVIDRMTALKDGLFSDADVKTESSATARKATAGTTTRTTQRGALKDRIMAALEAAGDAGVRVKELAVAIGTKPVNVHSWFHSSMKRYPAIKKIQGGHYRLEGDLGDRTPAGGRGRKKKGAATAAPKAKAKGKRGQSKRGELSARILGELENAGSQGLNVRDLAEKLGANYKNIYIWFATTGKKNSSIKKIGPATYRLTK